MALVFAPVASFGQGSMEERLQRVERLLDSGALVQMLEDLEMLRNEVQALRGEIEVQSHGITQLKQRQRDLYTGLDQRLLSIEHAPTPGVAPASDAVAAPAEPVSTPEVETGVIEPAPEPVVADAAPAADVASATGATGESTVAGELAAAVDQETSAAPEIDPVKEQQDYQAAFDLLTSDRYEDAARAFRSFLTNYPGGQFADNAQYWLGETYYVMRRFEAALQEFNGLIDNYPQSPKLTHAMLKVGYIHDEFGRPEEAKEALRALTERHPESTAADLARKRLQRLHSQ